MTDAPDIDGALLDALEAALRDAVGREHAVTSDELADRITDEDTDANPKTREAIKQVMRDRGLPVVGGSNGYYIPRDPASVDDALSTLDGRIAGIEERKQLLENNWQEWHEDARDEYVCEYDTRSIDSLALRKRVQDVDGVAFVERREAGEALVHGGEDAIQNLRRKFGVEDVYPAESQGGDDSGSATEADDIAGNNAGDAVAGLTEEQRQRVEDDPVLTVDDVVQHQGGGSA